MKTTCPTCDYKINIGGRPRLGQRFVCSRCRVELELVWLNPPELNYPKSTEDDEDLDDEEG